MSRYLSPGEEIQLEARPHGIALALPLGRALFLAALGVALVVFGPHVGRLLLPAGAALLGAAAVFAAAAVLRWDRTVLVVTTEKLVVVHGVLSRRAAAVRLARVGALEVEQSLVGRILGYGTIIAGNLEIPYVARPSDVCRLAR